VALDSSKLCPCGLYGNSYGDCCEHKGPEALGNAMQRTGVPTRLEGTRVDTLSSFVGGDTRFRIVWNVLWNVPQEQSFHQFLDALIGATLGKDWFQEQNKLPVAADRHVLVRWRSSLLSLVERPPDKPDGAYIRTGVVEAYMHFGYDLYWLQIAHKLPERLVIRLKTREYFQGARYEVLVAAVFARAGFDIEWLDDEDDAEEEKHCEFIATHKKTGTKLGVETKSRQRSGALHFRGDVSLEKNLKGDIFGLYETAIKQLPEDIPSLVFIDANWKMSVSAGTPAYSNFPIETYPWIQEVRDELQLRWSNLNGTTAETGVFVTSFAYYYEDSEGVPAPIGVSGCFMSPKPTAPLNNMVVFGDLDYCLRHNDFIPRQL
jgi:hypothetical protein